jgi:FAD/FMN-containing dehydrogenase
LTKLVGRVIAGRGALTPRFGRMQQAVTAAGLAASRARDLWGPAKNTQLYVKASTLRLADGGGVVLTRRGDVQRVVRELHVEYHRLVGAYQRRGQYPMNGAIEVRATTVDRAGEVGVDGAEAPVLSALRPRDDHPEWDTAVWFNLFTVPGTPHAPAFYAEIEAWARTNFGSYGCYRPEWSKGWAYTAAGAHTDAHALEVTIPDTYRTARRPDDGWDWAAATFDRLDPHRVFTNPFLDRLFAR